MYAIFKYPAGSLIIKEFGQIALMLCSESLGCLMCLHAQKSGSMAKHFELFISGNQEVNSVAPEHPIGHESQAFEV